MELLELIASPRVSVIDQTSGQRSLELSVELTGMQKSARIASPADCGPPSGRMIA
jgi:hypothetical protein